MLDQRTRRAVELSRRIHSEGYVPEVDAKRNIAAKFIKRERSCFIDGFVRSPQSAPHERRNFFCVVAEEPEHFVRKEQASNDESASLLVQGISGTDLVASSSKTTSVPLFELELTRRRRSRPDALRSVEEALVKKLGTNGMALSFAAAPSQCDNVFGVTHQRVTLSVAAHPKKPDLLAKQKHDLVAALKSIVNELLPVTGAKTAGNVVLHAVRAPPLMPQRRGSVKFATYSVLLTRIQRSDADIHNVVRRAVADVRQNGFLNYFAHERFHEFTRRGAHPGLHLLRGEFRAAAAAMVHSIAPRRVGGGANKEQLLLQESLLMRPPSGSIARAQQMLREALASCRDDDAVMSDLVCQETFREGLGPAFCKQLIHEFVCCVWNEILTRRVQVYGSLGVVEGDLLLPFDPSHTLRNEDIRHATKADVESPHVSVRDVVLPIPGASVQLPQNKMRDVVISTMAKYGLPYNPETGRWECFTPGNPLDISFRGAYRHAVHVPRITGAKLFDDESVTWRDSANSDVKNVAPTLSLKLDFTLPDGVFPTMLIREVCKSDLNVGVVDGEGVAKRAPEATAKHRSLELFRARHLKVLLKQRQRRYTKGSQALSFARVQQTIFKNRGPTRRSVLPSVNLPKSVV